MQERQLKMKLSHEKSHRVKKARPLVIGERCYALSPRDRWLDCFVVGICDTGRSYDIQIEATGAKLMRNHSHIRPRSPDIPLIHELYLQPKTVPSGNQVVHLIRVKTWSFQKQEVHERENSLI